MFGTYRTLLALMVVSLHLGGVPVLGAYAVFGFYILSGYLMTLIMQNNYGYDRSGLAKYAINRVLRIYPIYWLSCVISLILIIYYGEEITSEFHPAISMPDSIESIFRNLFLYFPGLEIPRLTPPSWALTVEIFYYIIIGLGISRSRLFTWCWFIASAIYTIYMNIAGFNWEHRYFSVLAASLPFSTGAIVFHYTNEIRHISGRWVNSSYMPMYILVLIVINWLIGLLLSVEKGSAFYMNYVLSTLMIVVLFNRKELPFISKKFDKIMGDFSYPIYLIHYQVGLVVIVLLNQNGFDLKRPDLILAFVSLPAIFFIAWVMTVTVEKPIEIIRRRVKPIKTFMNKGALVSEKN